MALSLSPSPSLTASLCTNPPPALGTRIQGLGLVQREPPTPLAPNERQATPQRLRARPGPMPGPGAGPASGLGWAARGRSAPAECLGTQREAGRPQLPALAQHDGVHLKIGGGGSARGVQPPTVLGGKQAACALGTAHRHTPGVQREALQDQGGHEGHRLADFRHRQGCVGRPGRGGPPPPTQHS